MAILSMAAFASGCGRGDTAEPTADGKTKPESGPAAGAAADSHTPESSAVDGGQSYSELLAQGDAFGLQGDFPTAIRWYTQAVKLEPQRGEGYAKRAAALTSTGALELALADYNQAIQLTPSDPELHLSRAMLQALSKRFDLALADCDAALRLNPKLAKARLYRANIHLSRGEFDAAIDDYNSILAADPSFASAYSNRGIAYRSKGDFARAIADYTSAIRYNTQFAEAYNNRGEIYLRQKDYERAMADFNKALHIDPTEFDAYNNRGDLYLLLGKPEQAIVDYTEIIDRTLRAAAASDKLHPSVKLAGAYLKRASAHLKAHHAAEAIADVGAAIQINRDDARAYAIRRDAYLTLGQKDLAQADDDRAKRLEQSKPTHAPEQSADHGLKK